VRQCLRIEAASRVGDIGAPFVVDLAVERREPRRQGRERVVVAPARSDIVDEPVETDFALAVQGCATVFRLSVTPTASTSTKRVFSSASGVTWRNCVGVIVRAPRPFICSK
jgi:hypothetical protein